MLVCVREVDKSELAQRYQRHIATPHFERYYSLYTNETSTTLVDVVDSRARKTFNYDVGIKSPLELQEQVVEPLLLTVLTPDRAAQAVVVVDGQAGNRFSTLMDAVDGVLANTARAAAAHPDVASLSFSAVTLEDNNTLTDILLPDQTREAQEVTILEDTQEQFTSVEDAHYISLESESTWEAALRRVANAFTEYKHQIFSFIFSFHPSTGRPNTTMQFISFTVNEVARGMKSSRHAVSSAAGLIECNSPTLTFTATKLLYLLKPSLLGQQPGAWVACFSPVSVLEAAERETFQEAFAVAQTASRLYSSRIALLNTSAALLPSTAAGQLSPRVATMSGRGVPESVEDTARRLNDSGDAPVAKRRSPPPTSPPPSSSLFCAAASDVTHGVRADTSYSQDDSTVRPAASALLSTSHLVQTPAGVPKLRRAEAGTSTHVQPPSKHFSQQGPQQQQQQQRHSIGVSAAEQADAAVPTQVFLPTEASASAHPRESIQRGPSEEQSAVRYEFDTYRAVVERAMAKLRAELRRCVDELQEAKEEMRGHRRQSRELRRELEMASESRHATVLENSELRQKLAEQRQRYERKVQELTQLSSASLSLHTVPSPSGQLTRQETSDATPALRDEVELLEVRVAELTELVAFHQSEIKDHVSKESAYRQRILDLEGALREKERDVIASRAAAQEARRAVDAVVQYKHLPTTATMATASVNNVPTSGTEPPHSRTSSAVLREDMHDVEDRAAEVELHLRAALDELQRERTQRFQLENLLKRRENEEVVRTAEELKAGEVVSNLQLIYERQLRELRAEMAGFRSQLEQQMPHCPSQPALTSAQQQQQETQISQTQRTPPPAATLSVSNESPVRATTPVVRSSAAEQLPQLQPQVSARPPTPSSVSHMQEGAAAADVTVAVGGGVNTNSGLASDKKDLSSSVRSQRSLTRPSPPKPILRTHSFEEYMQEEPHYELHRASFLRPRTRPAA